MDKDYLKQMLKSLKGDLSLLLKLTKENKFDKNYEKEIEKIFALIKQYNNLIQREKKVFEEIYKMNNLQGIIELFLDIESNLEIFQKEYFEAIDPDDDAELDSFKEKIKSCIKTLLEEITEAEEILN